LLSVHTPTETLLRWLNKLCYARAGENLAAAKLFFEYNVLEKYFNEYLDLVPKDDPIAIPPVTILGEDISIDYKDYYLQKLDCFDPRAALLGDMTSCCQSLHLYGNSAAIHGITRPEGGFYVLYEKGH